MGTTAVDRFLLARNRAPAGHRAIVPTTWTPEPRPRSYGRPAPIKPSVNMGE